MNKELAKLLARLTALKNNLPNHWIEKKYADEFNSILIELERHSEEDLNEFKLSASEIKSRIVTSSYATDEVEYSPESYCDRDFLLMKIDGILGYFTLLLQPSEIKNQMGFHVSENEQ